MNWTIINTSPKLYRFADTVFPNHVTAKTSVDEMTVTAKFVINHSTNAIECKEIKAKGNLYRDVFLDVLLSSGDVYELASLRIPEMGELGLVGWVYDIAPTRGTRNVQKILGYGSRQTASVRVRKARDLGLISDWGQG
jgi:hypothetical protein